MHHSTTRSEKKKEFADYADETAERMGIEEYTLYYREDRRNIRAGDYASDSDSFRVALKDWDVDGLYNEAGEDRLLTGPYESKKLSSRLSEGAVELKDTTHFQGGEQAYQVVVTPKNGRSIKIAPALEAKVPDRLEAGDSVPDISFDMLSGEQKRLEDFVGQSKYLFLDFWATWCAGCHQEVETLKTLHANPSVTVLSLNYNEGVAPAAKFIEKYDIEWPNGFSTPGVNQTFKVDGLPRGVLLGRDGTIIDPVVSAKEALSKIQRQTRK